MAAKQLPLLPDLPTPILKSARRYLDATGRERVNVTEWARRAYLARERWPQYRERAKWQGGRYQLRLWRDELREWIERVHDGDPARKEWVELAMIDWVLNA